MSKNTKKMRHALLMSVISMMLCCAMLVGTTFAWFTDEVSSTGNIIKSGTLKVEMYWADGNADPYDAATTWTDASEGEIFKSDLWEPGYTEVHHIKIVNVGTLALKYQLNILANGVVSDLADVIDVYFVDPAVQVADRADLADQTPVGTLNEVLAGMPTNVSGKLLPKDNDDNESNEVIVTVALKMQESAGNEYQNKSIGSDFAIQLVATQLTYENDSFDNQYDANAPFSEWDGTIPTEMPDTLVVDGEEQIVHVKDAAAFVYLSELSENWSALYTDGNGTTVTNYVKGAGRNYYYSGEWTISLEADIDLGNYPIDPVEIVIGQNTGYSTFNGNNHTIRNINATTGLFADDNRASYSNLTLMNVTATRGALAGSPRSSITNVTVKNATISGENYVGGLVGSAYSSVINCEVENSSVIATGKEAGALIGYIETTTTGTPAEVRNNTVSNVSVYAGERAAGLVAQVNNRVKVYNNTIDTVTVGAADTSKYAADAVISNRITAPENVYNNIVTNANVVSFAFVKDVAELKNALANGTTVIDAQGAKVGAFSEVLTTTNVPAGTTVTIKNAVVEGRSYGNGVDGTVVFENCTFTNTGAYSIHFDKGSGNVVFNNCKLDGWCSFGTAIKSVEMNDCTFTGNGTYTLIRFYQDVTLTNCTFDCSNAITEDNEYYPEGIDIVEGYTATVVNCTNVNGDIKDLFSEHDLEGTDGIVIFE